MAVQGSNKDAQAADMIAAAVARQPDAAYLLVQRALLLDQALASANTQIAALQAALREQKAANATPAPGFLDAASDWGNSAHSRPLSMPATTPSGNAQSVSGVPLQAYPAAPYYPAAPVYAPPPMQAGGGFFSGNTGNVLASVATTAAGVAAGAFLYQGISHMMGGQQSMMGGQQSIAENSSASHLNNNNNDGLVPGYFDQDASIAALDDGSSGDDIDLI